MRLMIRASGIDTLTLRLSHIRERLGPVLFAVAQEIAQDVAQQLSDAAPMGQGEGGGGPEGDGEGRLKESFKVETEGDGSLPFTVHVVTTQPRKLAFVTQGRGPVNPLHPKEALFWAGLDHPVAHAGPAAANDFVSGIVQAARDGAVARVQAALAELLHE